MLLSSNDIKIIIDEINNIHGFINTSPSGLNITTWNIKYKFKPASNQWKDSACPRHPRSKSLHHQPSPAKPPLRHQLSPENCEKLHTDA